MSEPLDVLAVMAHPDDAELLCGGSLIKSADRGERTGVLDLTRGEMGTRGSAELRHREAERAGQIMGLAVRRNAGLPDASLENSAEARNTVAAILRELKPRVIVTHWLKGRHRDHRIAAELVRDAAFLARLAKLPAAGEPHHSQKVVYSLSFREDAPHPSFVVDITDQVDRKLEALSAYGSQIDDKTALGEVLPGGDRPVLEQIRIQNGHYGSLIRAPYGEPFWTLETIDVETLGALRVSTF